MNTIKRLLNRIRSGIVVETEMHHGELEVECITYRADGTIKNKETAVRPVNIMTHGDQVVRVEDITARPPFCLASPLIWGVYVVNDGLEYLARYCTQSTPGYFSWLAWDAGVTVEAAGTTALTSEITDSGLERALATVSYEASYKAVWQKTFAITANKTAKGCGCANQLAVGGKFLMVHAFASDKNFEAGETVQLTMKLTFSR
jgi:hypothetical protein